MLRWGLPQRRRDVGGQTELKMSEDVGACF
jgi:hypothetical protein